MPSRREAIELVARHGAAAVVDALAKVVSDERRARIAEVVDARLAGLTVVLENLYDPHNGAAAIRSVEGFGLTSLHVVDGAAQFSATKEISLGGEKWIDVHRHRDLPAAFAALAAAGLISVATTPEASCHLADLDPSQRYALWFGNEHDGMSADALAGCAHHISIPMQGMTRSFNLSVSVALLTAAASGRRRHALGAQGDLDEATRLELTARFYAQSVKGAAGILERAHGGSTRA